MEWTFDAIAAIGEKMRTQSKRVVERTEVVRFASPEQATWQTKALADLNEWMHRSDDHNKTLATWEAVYIQCGTCLRDWRVWRAENPENDLNEWIKMASAKIIEKRWV
jgi:hypothetical protein